MRIALFTDTYLPDINGVVSSIELLRLKLIENGHDVYVVCTYPGAPGNFKIIREDNIIRFPGLELKQLYGYAITSPFHFLAIDDLKKLNFDLIHVHTEFGVGIFARIVAKKLNIPLVATYHTTYEDYTHYVNPINSSLVEKGAKLAVAKLSKIYSDSCVKVISPSEKTKKMLISYGIDDHNIKVIPTGLNLDKFSIDNIDHNRIKTIEKEIDLKHDERVIVYVGRLAKEKSLDVVIRAMAIVKKAKARVKLIIVGSGPDEDLLHKLTTKLNLNDCVIFVGKKPQEEVPSYYHSADAFVSASTTETQGMTYLEALSAGLMVFARHDDAVENLIDVDKTGYFFEGENDLADKIINFSKLDPEILKINHKNCIAKTKPYSSDIFVTKVIDLYNEVLDVYHNYYEIDSIKLKNNYVVINVKNIGGEKHDILMSLDNYYEYGIRKDNRISHKEFEQYIQEEKILKAYLDCLRKLIIKDYTIKQMYDHLISKHDLSIDEMNNIIEKLEEKKLLDDLKYSYSKLGYYRSLFFSKDKIKRSLRKDGVKIEIINSCLESYDSSDEFDFAYKKALKYQKTIKNKSLKMKIQTIERKLYVEGYGAEAIGEAIKRLDFSDDELNHIAILQKMALKAKKKYERNCCGSELRNKVFKYLYAQGFEIGDIYVVIDEMDWSDSDE